MVFYLKIISKGLFFSEVGNMVGQPLLAPTSHRRKWATLGFLTFRLLQKNEEFVFYILETRLNSFKNPVQDKYIQSQFGPEATILWPPTFLSPFLRLKTAQSLHYTCAFWVNERSFPNISLLSPHCVKAITDTNGVFISSWQAF